MYYSFIWVRVVLPNVGTSMKMTLKFLLVLLIPMVSACSWVLVEAPPAGCERFNYVPCTRSKVVPALDAGVAAAATWVGMMLLTSDEFTQEFQEDRTITKAGGVLTFLSTGALAGFNANLGFKRTAACREAQLEVAARNRQGSPALPELPEFAWMDQLFPLPTLSVDTPALPVTIPLMRK